MPDQIMTADRLKKYSKTVLIELIIELRDRFNALERAAAKASQSFADNTNRLKQCQKDLADARKLNRKLKGGRNAGS